MERKCAAFTGSPFTQVAEYVPSRTRAIQKELDEAGPAAEVDTEIAGLQAGMVPAERTVTGGVGHGKKAARNIDSWLRETAPVNLPKHDLVSFTVPTAVTWTPSRASATA